MDESITLYKKLKNKIQFFKGLTTFKNFSKSIQSNSANILRYCINGKSINIKNIPNKIKIGDFKLKQFDGDKSRDESRIYFHKSKIVLKIRIVKKKGGLMFDRCIEYMNEIERAYYGIDIDLYGIIRIRNIINDLEIEGKAKIIKCLETNEIYFIYTFYRGVSLKRFKDCFFDRARFMRVSKIRIAKIILLKLVNLLIVLDDKDIFLSDMQIRNFGICD